MCRFYVYMEHLFFLNCHCEGAVIKRLSQRHTHTHSQWLSSPSTVSLWNVPLCSRTKVIMSLFSLVSGSNEINQSLGEESACASLFCHQCRDVGGGRDEPDVNQKTFSSPEETWFRQYQPSPSVTLNPWTMGHYGAPRSLNRLTDGWTWKGASLCLCAEEWWKAARFSTNEKQWVITIFLPVCNNKADTYFACWVWK